MIVVFFLKACPYYSHLLSFSKRNSILELYLNINISVLTVKGRIYIRIYFIFSRVYMLCTSVVL